MRFLKGFNWYLLVAMLVITAVVTYAGPVFGIVWTATITVPNPTSTVYTYPQIRIANNNSQLIAGGYADANMLDVLIKSSNSATMPMMPTEDVTWFTTPSISGNSYTTFTWSSDNPLKTSHQILVGNGGYITTVDHADLELASNFTLIMDGYFNTAAGVDKNILLKPNGAGYAFKFYISAANALTAAIDNGAVNATATGIASGEYEVKVIATDVNIEIYIDDVLEDSNALGGAAVPDTADNYTWMQNNVMPYVNLIKLWTK